MKLKKISKEDIKKFWEEHCDEIINDVAVFAGFSVAAIGGWFFGYRFACRLKDEAFHDAVSTCIHDPKRMENVMYSNLDCPENPETIREALEDEDIDILILKY